MQISDIEKQVVPQKEKQRTPEKRLQILKQWLEEKGVTVGETESFLCFIQANILDIGHWEHSRSAGLTSIAVEKMMDL